MARWIDLPHPSLPGGLCGRCKGLAPTARARRRAPTRTRVRAPLARHSLSPLSRPGACTPSGPSRRSPTPSPSSRSSSRASSSSRRVRRPERRTGTFTRRYSKLSLKRWKIRDLPPRLGHVRAPRRRAHAGVRAVQGEAAVGVAQGRGRRGYSTVSYPYPATFVNTIVGFKNVPRGGERFVAPPGGTGTGSSPLTWTVASRRGRLADFLELGSGPWSGDYLTRRRGAPGCSGVSSRTRRRSGRRSLPPLAGELLRPPEPPGRAPRAPA